MDSNELMEPEPLDDLMRRLNESEHEYQGIQKLYSDLEEMIWMQRNEVYDVQDGDIRERVLSKNEKLVKKEWNEISKRKSDISLGGTPCNKVVKHKILKSRTLVSKIENFNTDSKEKSKFLENLEHDCKKESFKYLGNPVIARFLNTFSL